MTPPEVITPAKGLGKASVEQQCFRCIACLDDGRVLIEATLQLASLRKLGTRGGDVPDQGALA